MTGSDESNCLPSCISTNVKVYNFYRKLILKDKD